MAFTEAYVSPSGAGAHDGSSPSNAWTFEEAVAAPIAAGTRANVLTGTHSLTGSRTLPSGTSENPIEWLGYHTTPGDLMTEGRSSASGQLNGNGYFPVISGVGYNVVGGSYCLLKNLKLTTTANNTAYYQSSTASNAWRCVFESTHANGSSACGFSNAAGYGGACDCDCVIASSNTSASTLITGRGYAIGNRCWNSTGVYSGQKGINCSDVGGATIGNVIYGAGTAIYTGPSTPIVAFNSWYNVVNGIYINGNATTIVGNVGWSHSGYALFGTTSSGNPLIVNNAFGDYSSGRLDSTTLGSIIEEIQGITLTADPFTNSGSGDFTLNNTAGGGALCRGASSLWGGFADLGAIQSQGSAGSGPYKPFAAPIFGGGFRS